ncbi:MAG: acyltransferase [Clostridiales Family XIII bacterium]|jgi:maltose O-acetyltransferase|nr:acyltransferase [Clostridiales Family XIII bacterium]
MKLTEKIAARLRGEEPTEKLVRKGLVVGRHFRRGRAVTIDSAHCWLIRIGDDVSLGDHTHILAHDATPQISHGLTRIAPVVIGDRVSVGMRTLIMPGVTIGDDAVILPGSIVTRDIPAGTVWGGTPARKEGETARMVEEAGQGLDSTPVFSAAEEAAFSPARKQEVFRQLLESGKGYVRV